MGSVGRVAASWRFFLLSLLWATTALAKDEPSLSVTKFKHPPLNINYFEDSDVIVFHDVEEKSIWRSSNAGGNWTRVEKVPKGEASMLYLHPYESKTAFVLTGSTKHYKTEDRGETWEEFSSGSRPSAFAHEILVFHAGDPNRIILNAMDCDGIFCDEEARYTTDAFKTVHLLRSYTDGCWWAKSTKEFTSGDAALDKDRTLCIVRDPLSFFKEDQRLYISDSFFALEDKKIQEFEPKMDAKNDVAGIANLAGVKKHILVATTSFLSDEMALYVTDDTVHWHRAMFPTNDNHDHSHQINQEAYTVLESTNYSIQIDVMTSRPSNPMGVIFTSNSNGTYFIENVPYTNRNAKGHVDFEKISGIQGIFLVNIVENGKEVNNDGAEKIIISQITFDDGRTFESINAGGDTIHLHSVTQLDNIGRVFSSPAPGLVMGNGNTGKSLGKFIDSNLYVSDNAGVTWKEALKGPHKYEFGDFGSILVAIKDSIGEDVSELSYSMDHGDHWESVALPDGLKMKPYLLTTTQDSTSLKFLLLGEKDETFPVVAIDFESLGKSTCKKEDMEDWHARADSGGKATCIMGHKQTYQRRKKTADCFLKLDFKDPVPETEDCECTDADFECDYNFQRDPEDLKVCKKVGPIPIPNDSCKGGAEDTFKGSSGWRLIPGNTCKRTSGKQKDDKVERKCSDGGGSSSPDPDTPASGEISHKQYTFDTELSHLEKIYLEKGDVNDGNHESVIVRPYDPAKKRDVQIEHRLWLTQDHGKSWNRILEGEKVFEIYPHLYFSEVAYFVSTDHKVIYTIDRGQSFHTFKVPHPATNGYALSFHPNQKEWLIWHGENCETVGGKKECFREASVSTDRGANWSTLRRYVVKCEFTGNAAYNFRDRKQVICMAKEDENPDGINNIMTSNDFFVEDKTIHKGPIKGIATMSEFILAAMVVDEAKGLEALASLDGKHFEPIHLPYNFHQDHQDEYTVLDSSTRSINLFVATSLEDGRRFGSVIKSNSNGTSYVLSAANVNCDDTFFVDYEKIPGLEGVALINVVANADNKKGSKEIQTKISHNDGGEWAYLPPPAKDADGKNYPCSSSNGDAKCALHLHHYTERDDKRRTFAATTTVGLFFGIGNVGSKLGEYKDADTFMTTDGGITWRNVKKGLWTWQYGDQGSIIVLVQRATHGNNAKTKIVSYSTDEGNTWTDYKFSDEEVTVLDLTTVRSGTSRNFLLWAKSSSDKLFSIDLDFTGLTNKPCQYLEDGDSDYDTWSPKHPLQDDDCLFGHVAKYLRKKPDRKCYNKRNMQRLHELTTCQCSRRDFECAYNFELDNSGQCNLVPGLKPLAGGEWCKNHPNETSWFEPTGYRRLPLTTCEGGNEMDKTSTEHPCDGYQHEFERKHRASGWAIFFAVVIPLAVAGGIGWYVWRNWNGKFGQIRLGENGSTFDSDQPWIKYPVIAISALVAVVAALPHLAAGLWRGLTGTYERIHGGRGQPWFSGGDRRFTTRDSFARRRGDYSAVDDDEGELLGEESDEEV